MRMERLGGWLEYSTELFEAATIKRMAAHFRTLLEAIVANPEQRISASAALAGSGTQAESSWIGIETETGLPPLSTFSERFDRQVERTPDAVAVSIGRVRLSYRELASRASAIAGRLCREDVRRDEVVVLFAERGIDFLAAMIAVQQAGGAFLPLDPTMPAARLAQIIQHSGARIVLTTQALYGGAATGAVRVAARRAPSSSDSRKAQCGHLPRFHALRSAGRPRVWRALSILPVPPAFRKER